jgi:hypothetical protein
LKTLEELALVNDAAATLSQLAVLVPTFSVGESTVAFAAQGSARRTQLRMRIPLPRAYDRRDPHRPDRRASGRGGGRRVLDLVPAAELVSPGLAS